MRMNILSPLIGGMVCIVLAAACQRSVTQSQSADKADKIDQPFQSALLEEHQKNQSKGPQFIQGDRLILGKVVAIASEQIEVDIGEVQPRFLPLKSATEKNFSIQPGDDLVLVLNEQNLVVDYHLLGDPTATHRIVRGTIAQNLPVGHHYAVVRAINGDEEDFEIVPSARSKIASIPVGVEAVFLLDETNKIVDATFANVDALSQARRQPEQKSAIKGAHQRIEGTIVEPLRLDRITIKTFDRHERSFFVHPLVEEKLASMKKGETVTVMIDTEDEIIDVAVPPR